MTTTVENPTTTPVVIGAPRGGPDVPTLRKDGWWVEPAITLRSTWSQVKDINGMKIRATGSESIR